VRPVAHHRAHGLAVVAEHGLALPCLALCLDGLGFADQDGHGDSSGDGDAALWGCELLRLEPQGARRLASLRPFPLPGAERAMREPRRSALGLLHAAGLLGHPGAVAVREAFSPEELTLLESALQSGLQAPLTSSAGRLFDAVAALLGLVSVASHEAQAGLALQAAADLAADLAAAAAGAYPLPIRPGAPPRLDWQPLLRALLDDIAAAEPVALCAARFHNGLVAGLVAAVAGEALKADLTAAAKQGPAPVALAGGCFQNRRLLEGLIAALRAKHGNWALFQALSANGAIVAGANAQALNPVLQGAKAAVFGAVDYISLAQQADGETIDVIFPASGTVAAPRPMMILKWSRHIDESKKFIDYVLSPEGQAEVAKVYLMPARSDIKANRPLVKDLTLLTIDTQQVYAQRKEILGEFAAAMGRK
jgi:hydrogenase maturation factor HypF (carbamoyltransferase family)